MFITILTEFLRGEIIIIIITIILLISEFFTPALADGFPLESEGQ